MWYNKISKDISHIPDAVLHYEAELQAAKSDVRITGNIEKAAANMPGVVEHRFNQLQEIEAILEYFNTFVSTWKIIRELFPAAMLKNTWMVRAMWLILKKLSMSLPYYATSGWALPKH